MTGRLARGWQPGTYDLTAIVETVTTVRNGQPVTRTHYRNIPHPGELIAWRDRRAYRVTAVEERAQANWHDHTTAAWEHAGRPDPDTWPGRERAVRMRPADQPTARPRGYGLYPWASTPQWWPLREQYPVCCDCRLIWPCPCDDNTTAAQAAMQEVDRLGSILPGCCWACAEPVTGRHHSVVFDGENLLLPGADPAVFHTSHSRKANRGTCRGQAEEYEQQWVAAGPGRTVRLRCPGRLYRHIGSSECTAGDDCPAVDASHAGYGHCTTALWTSRPTADGRETPVEEQRPLTNCGTRGCRGPKAPTDALTDEAPIRQEEPS
jgi:hypothetical protein